MSPARPAPEPESTHTPAAATTPMSHRRCHSHADVTSVCRTAAADRRQRHDRVQVRTPEETRDSLNGVERFRGDAPRNCVRLRRELRDASSLRGGNVGTGPGFCPPARSELRLPRVGRFPRTPRLRPTVQMMNKENVITVIKHSIKRVEAADLDELMPLMRAYCDFYEVSPPDVDLLALVTALIDDPEREGVQLLARDPGGRVAGFATLYWTWSTTKASRIGIMNDLFVAERARG